MTFDPHHLQKPNNHLCTRTHTHSLLSYLFWYEYLSYPFSWWAILLIILISLLLIINFIISTDCAYCCQLHSLSSSPLSITAFSILPFHFCPSLSPVMAGIAIIQKCFYQKHSTGSSWVCWCDSQSQVTSSTFENLSAIIKRFRHIPAVIMARGDKEGKKKSWKIIKSNQIRESATSCHTIKLELVNGLKEPDYQRHFFK